MGEPTFDFGNVNRRWRLAVLRASSAVQRKASAVDAVTADLDTSEDDIDAAYEALDEAMTARDALMVQVIDDVPREWLVTDAPDEVDWSEPASMEYVRADRTQSLDEAMQLAMARPAGN